MNDNRQVILQGPLNLLTERYYLVIQTALVPVKVQSGLTYSYITAGTALLAVIIQNGLKSGELAVEIIGQILGVQSYHGTAQIRPCVTHPEQVIQSIGIDIGKKQQIQSRLTRPFNHIGQVLTERIVIDMTMGVNQSSH